MSTWPLGSGVYNGIQLPEDTDLQQHFNTKQPTSYFSAASQYDFFGGYDHGKQCGVVHVANHHIAPGKKLFTWAYNQLSESWERSLTDTDGAYAELMAGSYTDNQPDFAWLEPYETKKFSQFWFPIAGIGAPNFATTAGALSWNVEDGQSVLALLTTASHENAKLVVTDAGQIVLDTALDLGAGRPERLTLPVVIDPATAHVKLVDFNGATILNYRPTPTLTQPIPEPWTDIPGPDSFQGAQALHLAGVHVQQYRSPKDLPDRYWQAALEREPDYLPALIDLGLYRFQQGLYDESSALLERARSVLTRHNGNPRSGEVFYALGLVRQAQGDTDAAYDLFYKASWNEAMVSKAMTQLAGIDGQRGGLYHHARARR